MAGRPVRRKPRLVFLGTTSLYGVGSSQYNRIRVPTQELGGRPGSMISFQRLGESLGYGSFHLSADTVREIDVLISQKKSRFRRVNSIFGEGVSPRLRKIRDGLALIGLPADTFLKHGSPRIVYGVTLASNFRDVLLGKARRVEYLLPQTIPEQVTRRIVNFWQQRWLSRRIQQEDVLKEVENHALVHPITHGARVVLPQREDELPLLSFFS